MNAQERLAALQQARDGDEQARGRLLASFSPYVRVIVRALHDPRVQARIDDSDLMQDCFVEAHRNFDSFRGATIAELTSWLRVIVLRTVGRSLREHGATEKRDPRRERSLEHLAGMLADSASSPSARAVRDEEAARIAEALAEMPDDMQQVLLGRHVEDLSHAEIAGRLDRSEAATRMLYLRALRQLRDILGKDASF